jgi:hypothetical protein
MATNYKIAFKNHCTPQWYVDANDRWYLDEDVGAKLSSNANANITLATEPVYAASVSLTTSPTQVAPSTQDFVFIKNLGTTESDIIISLDGYGGKWRILLAPYESFATEIGPGHGSAAPENNHVWMKAVTGTQTAQTLAGT